LAYHTRPRTTQLYDRTGDEITPDEVERITIYEPGTSAILIAQPRASPLAPISARREAMLDAFSPIRNGLLGSIPRAQLAPFAAALRPETTR
jgi:hypothetical protein